MIKNIVLDVGNVLVDWNPEASLHKLGFDEKTISSVLAATVKAPEWNDSDRGILGPEEMLDRLIANAPEYKKEIRMFWENIHLAIEQFDYTRPWIQSMKAHGYRVYILSNYAYWTYINTQQALSFLQDVDGALFSYEIHQIKPEPEIYKSLLQRFDLKAEECIFLDDLKENAEGAKAVGMEAIRFTTYNEVIQLLKDYNIEL